MLLYVVFSLKSIVLLRNDRKIYTITLRIESISDLIGHLLAFLLHLFLVSSILHQLTKLPVDDGADFLA